MDSLTATVAPDGVVTVASPDLDGLSRDTFCIPHYGGDEYAAEVALTERGLYRVGPWRDAEHGAIVCAVALLPDVGVRAGEVTE